MKLFISILCMALIPTFVGAQELAPIKLPAPDMKRSCTLMKALSDRHSDRTFSGKELSLQDLSDLLWAANGINRKEKGMRTAPSALNKQDIDIYAVMKKGAYRYDAGKHELTPVAKGDFRQQVAGGQDFVMEAPLSLVLVSDLAKFGNAGERTRMMGAMDAGIVSQNINLFCAGAGLSTVPRATMDQATLRKTLNLSDMQVPMLNNPVGYPAE